MKKTGLILLFLMILAPLVSAEISISPPKSIYSVGDAFAFSVTLMPGVATNNFFIAKIVCSNGDEPGESEIYRSPQTIASEMQKNMDVSGKFDNFLIGGLSGTCHLNIKYGYESADSGDFQLIRGISVSVNTDKVILEPGERFNVSGSAIKNNGNAVEKGFIEIKLSELNISSFRTIEGGKFNLLFDSAENTPAGDYDLHARIYEKDGEGKITNEGEGITRIRIKQVIKKNEIAISSQNVNPGSDFVYTILLYDQSNIEAIENVEVALYKPSGELFSRNLLKSGEADNIAIGLDFMPGNWVIESSINNLSASRTFYINELEDVSYKLANGTLSVTNTGNVPFKKAIEIVIGDESVIEEISVEVGETKRYALSAPDGEYPIKIKEGENEEAIGSAFLTGSAVGVKGEGSGFWGKSSILLWLMLISLGILVASYQYSKISKKAYFGKTLPDSAYATPAIAAGGSSGKNMITEGVREECSIIALKLKNNEEIERAKGSARDTIERVLTRARDAKAKIYSDKNYKTMIFAPSITKEKDNSLKAVSIAREIETMILEHNKRFGEKIMFGVGVHNGEMILENINGQFRFNAIGNTMPYVKKIADSVNSGTGVSEFVHRRLLGKVRSDRIEGTNYWRVSKIRDRELHSEFINKFVQRQKEDSFWKK